MNNTQQSKTPHPPPDWQTMVAESVRGLKYGVIQIVVHDAKVVQVERTERVRFDHTPTR